MNTQSKPCQYSGNGGTSRTRAGSPNRDGYGGPSNSTHLKQIMCVNLKVFNLIKINNIIILYILYIVVHIKIVQDIFNIILRESQQQHLTNFVHATDFR